MVGMSPFEYLDMVWLATNPRMPDAGSRNEQQNKYANCISTSKDRVASDT